MDGGAWQATVHGVARSRTPLSYLARSTRRGQGTPQPLAPGSGLQPRPMSVVQGSGGSCPGGSSGTSAHDGRGESRQAKVGRGHSDPQRWLKRCCSWVTREQV